MIATQSESARFGGAETLVGPPFEASDAGEDWKMSSNSSAGGASGQASRMASRSEASPEQISAGEQSFIIATSSDGDCREYSGTTTRPSAMMARSVAIQSIPFA